MADLTTSSAIDTFMQAANASAARTALGLGTAATQASGDFATAAQGTDARTPTAHATSHKSGGSDAIKLDELDAPTDVTTLNATTSAHGLLPKLGGGTTNFLRADGSWAAPAGGVATDDTRLVAFAADAGSTDTYVVTLSPAPSSYTTGAHYRFRANTANTGAATVNFNGLGAKTIVKAAGGITTALANNDIRAGQWVDVVYDGTNMQMQSTLGNAAAGLSAPTLAGINSVTSATGQPLTLATLDSNTNIKLVPHGTGAIEVPSSTTGSIVPAVNPTLMGLGFDGINSRFVFNTGGFSTVIYASNANSDGQLWGIKGDICGLTDNNYTLGYPGGAYRWKQALLGQLGIKIGDGTNGAAITASGTSPNESLVLSPGGTGIVVINNITGTATVPSGKAGLLARSGELYAVDSAGNETLISPHSPTAPASLYRDGEPNPTENISYSANFFQGVVTYQNRETGVVYRETFAEHNARLSLTGDEALIAKDWDAVQAVYVAESEAARAEWQAKRDEWEAKPENARGEWTLGEKPALHVAESKPDWATDQGETIIAERELAEAKTAKRAAMAAVFDALPKAVRAVLFTTRVAAETAMDRDDFDLAKAIVEAQAVPPELEATKAAILAHFD